jgi:hypothetical protein
MKRIIRKFYYHIKDFGIDVKQILNIIQIFRFLRDRRRFISLGGVINSYKPMVSDYYSDAGTVRGQYFHHDLLVAQEIFRDNPKRHVDFGSRFDGFVAHVASFRKIEVVDIRALPACIHENISFIRNNVMTPLTFAGEKIDSISCLNALEHFGLGRYGDPINPSGHIIGFRNMWSVLSPNGKIYIAVPIATNSSVCFNAHRIFLATDIFTWFAENDNYSLLNFDVIDDLGELRRNQDPSKLEYKLEFGCGVYTLVKKS